jgi:serine/threonine protein kinase
VNYRQNNHRRSYRAPETIFSATDYDPYAVDTWSLGAICAEFFTPVRFIPNDLENSDDPLVYEDEENETWPSFINPPASSSQRGRWLREPIFNAKKGSIGLAWSIFKTRGTPNDSIWPVRQFLSQIVLVAKFFFVRHSTDSQTHRK